MIPWAPPGDAHGRLGQAQDPDFDGSVAEQRGCGPLVPGDELAAVFGQQIAGAGGAGAVQPRLAEGQIHLEGAPDKSELFGRDGEGVLPQLGQGVAVDQRRGFAGILRAAGQAGLFPNGAAVLGDADDVGVGVLNGDGRLPFPGLHRGLDEDAAADPGHFHLDHASSDHLFGLAGLFRRDAVQAFQALVRVCAHRAQGGGVGVAHLAAARYAAGEGIFEHAAVQPQDDPAHQPVGMPPGLGHGKGDGSRLGDAQGGLHILADQLGQFVHGQAPFPPPFHKRTPARRAPAGVNQGK